jgi:4-hydroxyphenylacetate 3-monooxygenase
MATPAEPKLPTGAEYRESRRDGRQVWMLGERIEDITTHPATAPVVDAYADWWDRHHDPASRDALLTAPDAAGNLVGNRGRPLHFAVPRTPDDLHALGEAVRVLSFPSGGNLTHPPGYGGLIMLGVMDTVGSFGDPERAAVARAYYERLCREGLHMVSPFAVAQSERFRAPRERNVPRVVRETDGGVIVSGSLGLGTSLCYADVTFIGVMNPAAEPEQAIWFSVPINAPGVKILARKPVVPTLDSFLYPLSARYDELDCSMRLDEVFVPWEDVFAYRDVAFCNQFANRNVTWLLYYHLARLLARAEFSFGLALAVTQAQGIKEIPAVAETLTDLLLQVEPLVTALRASAADAQPSPTGAAVPELLHLVSGTVFALRNRASIAETVRTLAGLGSMMAPSLADLDAEDIGAAIAPNYEGGGLSAAQRAALMHLVSDHTASGLEGRGAALDALATAGMPIWRLRANLAFQQYDEVLNGVLAAIAPEHRPPLKYEPKPPGR